MFTRDFRHTPEKVWAAITEPAQLAKWSPFTVDRNLGAAGDAVLTMIDGADASRHDRDGAPGRPTEGARIHLG